MKPQTVAVAAAAALVLFIFLSAEVQKSECLGTTTTSAAAAAEWGCNSTRIGDCLIGGGDGDGEGFLMESETSRRLLAGGQRFISPGVLNTKRPFCRGDVAGSCIGRPNKFYDKRPCGYSHLCRTSA